MVSDNIQDLLILQERYLSATTLKNEIAKLPKEVETLKAKISEEEAALEKARQTVLELERQRKEIELEVSTADEQISRYKNQQLQVKKNDEYQALTHEIELTQNTIGDLETRELELMETIDEENSKLEQLKGETAKRVEYQESLIIECNQKLENLKGQLGGAENAYSEQVGKMDAKLVKIFEVLTTQVKRPPYVVEVSGQNCGGCHMRVSNDVHKQAKMGEIARCDQCSRIVYFNR